MSHKKNKREKIKIASGKMGNLPFDIDTEIKKAFQYHQSGQFEKAQEIYKEILEINPNHSDSLHLSGIIAHQSGKNDIAANLINRAIQTRPEEPVYYLSLGSVYKSQGSLDEAILSYQKALELNPDYAEAYNNMGNAVKAQGRLDEAILHYKKALELKPNYAEAYSNLGIAFYPQGKLDEAIWNYQKALQLNPDLVEVWDSLGVAFYAQDRLDEAVSCFQKALELNPDYAKAYNNLGIAFYPQGKLDEAILHYKKALELNPDYAEAYNNLGAVFKSQSRINEAISCYQKALQIKPDFVAAHSNLLYVSNYHESIDSVQLFLDHKQWAKLHALPLSNTIQPHLNDRSPERRLRVGYVSPDFCMHPVVNFIEPILASHDRSVFEIFCYSDVVCPDAATDHLKSLAGCWRDIAGMSDEQVADLVHKDEIDILVDLAGHTAYNRMLLFARKPAPIQATYLGYPNTTGLSTMDYRITDSWADPSGQTDHLYTEELVRLPHCFLCYRLPGTCPETTKLPALTNRQITFGSFNNLAKVTPEVIALWSAILEAVPDARMIMKSKPLADKNTRQHIREMFVKNGVTAARVNLIGFTSTFAEHLELYNSVDIGLDTFPYNGATTTCEALLMGVPVIVLAGQTHGSRVWVSLLSNMGLPELIAKTTEDYVEKAVKLAGDLKCLEKLRTNLRDMMSHSALTDAHCFTCALEDAFRKMWGHWCGQYQSRKVSISSKPSVSEQASAINQNGEDFFIRKLHIGGKAFHPEWEVINAVPAKSVDHVGDAKNLSRFGDEIFLEIYASHVLEHFDYVSELDAVLKEWARVLQPGGKLYISVPDMDKLANLFLMKDKLNLQERFHVMRMMFGGQTSAYDYHKVGFNREILETFLIKAGFINLRVVDDFGIFKDTSTMKFHGIPISLNIMAQKAAVPPGENT
ncbi:MAG TPA: tetratricopeptide repeat protein [Anaerolineae bacterium]|nr:tetratricopeptide repeat protein [Anaerolineae bacterium]